MFLMGTSLPLSWVMISLACTKSVLITARPAARAYERVPLTAWSGLTDVEM